MLKFRLLLLVFAAIFAAAPVLAEVSDVRVVGDGAPTRITVWTDTPQDARAFLSEQAAGRTIVLPLKGISTAKAGTGTGGVVNWSLMGSELSFLLDRPLMVARVLTLPPSGSEREHRVIIDLETVSAARFASVAKRDRLQLAKALATPDDKVRDRPGLLPDLFRGTSPTPRRGKYVIVVDAGHGGKDPGTQAASGVKEKDIVLKAALELQRLLAADPRYEVRLTRDTDKFIELEDRVTLARDWGASLFISLHADAAGKTTVSGASVYTISAQGETRIDRESNKNDWRIPMEDGTPERISGILEDLVKRETKTHSADFAEFLLPELREAGPVLRDTHKNAGFYVLLAPDVPAVLLELGFLTNAEDARRLDSTSGRKKSMQAVKRGIDRFFDRQERLMADTSG
ncbi:MAG: N-acetylmuramoyl-L-alanine amidase [Hyphomonas sp.]|uniref:N-acetylmuramoyl-L-alanine amidase family protein n=1 Tax=Hyphomonas sp. TaxID=87 RepID=UPI0035297A56